MSYGQGRHPVFVFAAILSLLLSGVSCRSDTTGGSTAIVAIDRMRLRSSTAEAARTVGELKGGDRVAIVESAEAEGVSWVKIQGPDGMTGWAQMRNLVDQEAFDRSHRLAEELKQVQNQALGRSKASLKLRLTPDRSSEENVLSMLPSGTEVEILGRERRPRPAALTELKDPEAQTDTKYDEWYKVRIRENQVTPAGWIYGGSVELQIPPEIVYYPSSGRRIVGWQTLGEASDAEGRSGRHFLVLEREMFGPDLEADFDRIKVLAYDPASRDYSTPFREDLSGRFPVSTKLEGRRGSFEVPETGGSQKSIRYEFEVLEGSKFKVSRLTPREPVQQRSRK